MDKKQLQRRLNEQEFALDQWVKEFEVLDSLLKEIGFSEGVITVKEVVKSLLEEERIE